MTGVQTCALPIWTPIEIINKVFGGKENYDNAIQELEHELFYQEKSA